MDPITIPVNADMKEYLTSAYTWYKDSVCKTLERQKLDANNDEIIAIEKQLKLLARLSLENWALQVLSDNAMRLLVNRQQSVLAASLGNEEPIPGFRQKR